MNVEPRPESPRDEAETGFTDILRSLVRKAPEVLAVAFVDEEGECVDYCTSLSAFEAKIAGAQLLVIYKSVAHLFDGKLGLPRLVVVEASERSFVCTHGGEGYTLMVVVDAAAGITSALHAAIESTLTALRVEAGIPRPEMHRPPVFADVRESPWGYAPIAFYERGERIEVRDVLGRWTETGGAGPRVCFLVRTETGEETVLRHDRLSDLWER